MPPRLEGSTPRRVKVYLLEGDDWIDNGTGYCVGEVDEKSNKPYFLVRNELNSEEIILKSFLEGNTQYQRQQETLIVWTNSQGKDLALSFQETEACAELCEFIIRIQQERYAPEISLYYVLPAPQTGITDGEYQSPNGAEITELITGPINYPQDPTIIENLPSVLEAILQGSNSQYTRSSMQKFIIEDDFFPKLIMAFEKSESAKDLDSLHTICEIVKTLILYNETGIIENLISSEQNLYGLIGILEYDNDYPLLKACYRDYFKDKQKFKVVIELDNQEIMDAMRKDLTLNFLKDVVFARFLDDQTFNLMSSLIYFNQVEIINILKNEKLFLSKLFAMYDDQAGGNPESTQISHPDISIINKKRDGVKMIHQYINIAKSLQSFQKSEFFGLLIKSGLFKMVSFALNDSNIETRTLGTELIVVIIEQDVTLVNTIDNQVDDNQVEEDDDDGYSYGGDQNDEMDENDKFDKFDDDHDDDNNDDNNESNDDDENDNDENEIDKDEDSGNPKEISNGSDKGNNQSRNESMYEAHSINLRLSDDMTLIKILSGLLVEDKNPGLKMQAFEALRILLDSNIAVNNNSPISNDTELELKNGIKKDENDFQDINTSNYFQAFYKKVAPGLFQNLFSTNEDIVDNTLIQHLLELVSFCIKEHDPNISKSFFIDNNIIQGIGQLVQSKKTKTSVKLSAIRTMKNIILSNDIQYISYLIHNDVLKYFFQYFNTIIFDDNLANSSCLDLLEVILKKCRYDHSTFQPLAKYIVESYKDVLEKIDFVNTGKDLIQLIEAANLNLQTPMETTEIETDVEKPEEDRREKRSYDGIDEAKSEKKQLIKSEK